MLTHSLTLFPPVRARAPQFDLRIYHPASWVLENRFAGFEPHESVLCFRTVTLRTDKKRATFLVAGTGNCEGEDTGVRGKVIGHVFDWPSIVVGPALLDLCLRV